MTETELEIVFKWWEKMNDDHGERAVLRRASKPAEVVFHRSFHELLNKFEKSGRENIACVAGLCSHIKENSGLSFGQSMAEGLNPGEKSRISNLRFRRLLSINDKDELYHAMIRIIRSLGSRVNVRDMARIVYWWNERAKKDLAYEFYKYAKE